MDLWLIDTDGKEIAPVEQLGDPLQCQREVTVSALWERVKQYHVVHVHATPASGKTTLSRLLKRPVESLDTSRSILLRSWSPDLPEHTENSYQNNSIGYSPKISIPALTGLHHISHSEPCWPLSMTLTQNILSQKH
jgi:hypothetical protein